MTALLLTIYHLSPSHLYPGQLPTPAIQPHSPSFRPPLYSTQPSSPTSNLNPIPTLYSLARHSIKPSRIRHEPKVRQTPGVGRIVSVRATRRTAAAVRGVHGDGAAAVAGAVELHGRPAGRGGGARVGVDVDAVDVVLARRVAEELVLDGLGGGREGEDGGEVVDLHGDGLMGGETKSIGLGCEKGNGRVLWFMG